MRDPVFVHASGSAGLHNSPSGGHYVDLSQHAERAVTSRRAVREAAAEPRGLGAAVMGEADVLLTQAEEKRPESGLLPAEDPVVWSHEVEVCLFHAMIGHKPVGVNRHFHMICIRDKFSQNIGRQVSSSIIWDHLGSMYDMQALHESEILPFPNSEKSFSLPDDIIQEVKEGKLCSEEDNKEEFRMEREPPSTHEEGSNSSVKVSERAIKERERGSEGKEEKRKRRTDKLLTSNPASPGGGGAKRRRT